MAKPTAVAGSFSYTSACMTHAPSRGFQKSWNTPFRWLPSCRGPLSTGNAYLQQQEALYKANLMQNALNGHDFPFHGLMMGKPFTGQTLLAQPFQEVRQLQIAPLFISCPGGSSPGNITQRVNFCITMCFHNTAACWKPVSLTALEQPNRRQCNQHQER